MFSELLKNVMNLGIITEDDVKRLTAIELMMLIIERTNGTTKALTDIGANLESITLAELNKWMEDGTLEKLINQTALQNINKRLDNHLSVSVKDFGAKGDGVTDDRQAIQNAINSLIGKGGIVYFPVSESCYLLKSRHE